MMNLTRGRLLLAGGLLGIAAGCAMQTQPAPVGSSEPPPPTTAVVKATPAASTLYEIDPAASLLQVLVYRDGAMARLGHNHVIASHDLTGQIVVGDNPADSAVELSFPVARLGVDEPEWRRLAGEDFSAPVPDSAREGTKRNLLSPSLLDAEKFPRIELRSRGAAVTADGRYQMNVEVTIKGITHVATTVATVERADSRLAVSGQLVLRQTELGLTPFSVMLGALTVRDDMNIGYRIVAHVSGNQ